MISLYEELSAKVGECAPRARRDGARRDLGLLLFAEREAIYALWKEAELLSSESPAGLRACVEKLKPLFGERP